MTVRTMTRLPVMPVGHRPAMVSQGVDADGGAVVVAIVRAT